MMASKKGQTMAKRMSQRGLIIPGATTASRIPNTLYIRIPINRENRTSVSDFV